MKDESVIDKCKLGMRNIVSMVVVVRPFSAELEAFLSSFRGTSYQKVRNIKLNKVTSPRFAILCTHQDFILERNMPSLRNIDRRRNQAKGC